MWKVNQFEAVLKALLVGALKKVSGGLQVVVSVLNVVCCLFFFPPQVDRRNLGKRM